LTDGQIHDVALYFVDWDSTSRQEQVQLTDALTGALLDTETVASFHGGVYLQWAVGGDVTFTFTTTAGADAVLSGLFFDPNGATATLVKKDTPTEGSWIGAYGTQGYNVIGSAFTYPSYAVVTPSGNQNWTWAASTSDTRALQTPGGGSRIAACWYSGSSFTVTIDLTDGQIHDVALYFVDWDSTSRQEQVQVTNASTGSALDTETVSSFHAGVYLRWAIRGNVTFTFTQTAGVNAVLSGLFFDPSATATLVKQDTTTEGSWIGAYGTQGYNVIGSSASYPSYALVTRPGALNWTWAASTSDTRGLQTPGGGSRIAACWYSPSAGFTATIDLTDGQVHDVALYFVDWDSTSRQEQVQLTDALTGAVLDTETVSSFHAGVYLQWAIRGNVTFTFRKTAGADAVLSGLFFDPSGGATATLVKQDTTTEGSWTGAYGSRGYNVIGNAVSYPAYATVSASGQSNYTWAATTNDSRALEDASGSGRIAACWYSGTSLSINLTFTDGQTHDLALYALDWDNQGRSEQIQIGNATTGAVLDTETVSSFTSGVYLQWAISGSVIVKVSKVSGPNAVISGLFFD
jgi:hypothetical protein